MNCGRTAASKNHTGRGNSFHSHYKAARWQEVARPRGSVGLHEMAAPVLLPAGFVALVAEGLLLAEADGAEAVGGNAQRNEVLLHGGGAAIAEGQVVFRGATLVAVAFDGCLDRRVSFQEVRGLGKRGAGIRTNVGLVVVEIGVAHFSQKEFVVRGPLWRRRRRRRIYRDGCGGTGGAPGTAAG